METYVYIKNSDYQISNLGNVLKPDGKPIKFRTNNYRKFEYADKNGIIHTAMVHRLVALYFCNPPEGTQDNGICIGYHIHHKNRVRSDNRAENLVYLTINEHQELHKELNRQKKNEPKESELPSWKRVVLVNY